MSHLDLGHNGRLRVDAPVQQFRIICFTEPDFKSGCWALSFPNTVNTTVGNGMEWNMFFGPKAQRWDRQGHSAPKRKKK